MKQSTAALLETYQVRKSKAQKQAFIHWVTEHLAAYGYTVREEAYSKSGSNLIVGDAASAEILLTAHYDTQPNCFFPMYMGFSNWVSFTISQCLPMLPLALIALLVKLLLDALSAGHLFSPLASMLCIVYCAQFMFGFANRHTANDNTSGVAALLSILEELPQEDRRRVCVVFFDQEELGLVGSQKFYKRHKAAVQHKPVINFDCVGDGDTLTFVMKKQFRNSAHAGLLQHAAEAALQGSGKSLRFAKALWNIYMSDQLHFSRGVGVVAAKKAPVFGYYINNIHSQMDTRLDAENIALLTDTALRMIRGLDGLPSGR